MLVFVQELLPLVVTVVLPLPNQAVDQNAPEIQRIALQYNVAIHLKPVRRRGVAGGRARVGESGCL